jgi:hypothetical protein
MMLQSSWMSIQVVRKCSWTWQVSFKDNLRDRLTSSGKDATDAFEDVGHSDEAREILAGLLKGELQRRVYPVLSITNLTDWRPDPQRQRGCFSNQGFYPTTKLWCNVSAHTILGLLFSYPIIFIIAVIVAFVAYKFYQSQ